MLADNLKKEELFSVRRGFVPYIRYVSIHLYFPFEALNLSTIGPSQKALSLTLRDICFLPPSTLSVAVVAEDYPR